MSWGHLLVAVDDRVEGLSAFAKSLGATEVRADRRALWEAIRTGSAASM